MDLDYVDFVDSHIHLDLVARAEPERLDWLRKVGCLPVSWAFAENVQSAADLERTLHLQRETIHRLNAGGLPCFFLCGVHPRNITADLKPGAIAGLLSPFLDDRLCLGIGEIGLETASGHEKEIFAAQLELAERAVEQNKVLGVHTPRHDKPRVTREILTVLETFPALASRLVIDHCTPETLGGVVNRGFWAGVTMSPIKTSAAELHRMIRRHPDHLDRIMLNTDSGSLFYEDLYNIYADATLPDKLKTGLVKHNALDFYRIFRP